MLMAFHDWGLHVLRIKYDNWGKERCLQMRDAYALYPGPFDSSTCRVYCLFPANSQLSKTKQQTPLQEFANTTCVFLTQEASDGPRKLSCDRKLVEGSIAHWQLGYEHFQVDIFLSIIKHD